MQFYRDGNLLTRTADLPLDTPFPPGVPRERFSNNFNMSYQLMPLGSVFAARVTRLLTRDSPLQAVRLKPKGNLVHLEPGDMIVLIDGERIRNDQDVAKHYQKTDIVFIDVRTGMVLSGSVNLP